ncbi:unnamed protein product [Calypogeia fissa]
MQRTADMKRTADMRKKRRRKGDMKRIWDLLDKAQYFLSTLPPSPNDFSSPQPNRAKRAGYPHHAGLESGVPLRTVRRFHDDVFEIYAPREISPSVEIVFFHGLQLEGSHNAHLTTWLSACGSDLWPMWMEKDFPDARLLIFSYNAYTTRTDDQGLPTMFKTGEDLLGSLTKRAQVGQHGCPVILVGHSIGGLIMKELCLEAKTSKLTMHPSDYILIENFLHNLNGLFFYATPHLGTRLGTGPLFEDFNSDDHEALRWNDSFRRLQEEYGWKTFGVGEGRSVRLKSFKGKIVANGSAQHDVVNFRAIRTADHFSVCRPHSQKSPSFTLLCDFVVSVMQDIIPKEKVVGLERQLISVQSKLKKARRLGMVGMGGIGKSTLAEAVFRSISSQFEYSCFLRDVDQKNPYNLRKRIIADLYTREECKEPEDFHWTKVHENFQWSTLREKNVLIVLDGVESASHVQVMTESDCFSDESRIIVTSRNRRAVISEGYEFHFMTELDEEDSRRLFCLHGFRITKAPNPSEDWVGAIVKNCGGLPLVLQAARKYFSKLGTGLSCDDALKHFDHFLSTRVKSSYDSLAEREQEMFLDISMFFHGERLSKAKLIWKMCGWEDIDSTWTHLLDRGLVTELLEAPYKDFPKDVSQMYSIIHMNVVLRDMGQKKANSNSSRVCCTAQRLRSVKRTPGVQGLKIDLTGLEKSYPMNTSILRQLNRLRILFLDGGDLDGAFHRFPPRLVYLKITNVNSWIDSSPAESSFQHPALQYLEIESCQDLKTLPCFLEQLHALKHLRISGCPSLTCLPDCIGQLRVLKHLEIINCENLVLPHTLGQAQSLKRFNIQDSSSLGVFGDVIGKLTAVNQLDIMCRTQSDFPPNIPSKVLGMFRALEYLKISEDVLAGDAVKALPDALGELKSLELLWLKGTTTLTALPRTLGNLESLRVLRLEDCWDLQALPDTLGNLKALESLTIQSWYLKTLPDTLGELEALKYLDIEAPQLTALPNNFGMLQGLEYLHISGGKGEVIGMEALPDSIGELKALKQMELESFFRLESLPDQSLKGLKSLERLKLHGFERLTFLPKTLGRLKALKVLELSSCTDLRALPDTVVKLRALENLVIFHCNRLDTLPHNLEELESLSHIQTQSGQISAGCQDSLKRLGFRLYPRSLKQLGRKLFEPELHWYKVGGLPDSHKQRLSPEVTSLQIEAQERVPIPQGSASWPASRFPKSGLNKRFGNGEGLHPSVHPYVSMDLHSSLRFPIW